MYVLYGSTGSGSASVEAALALSGAEYRIVQTSTAEGKHLTEDFKLINPRQQVPALQLPDSSIMTEGSAMMLHLADALPAAQLAPLPGSSARAQHDRWLIFMAVNIYEGELRKGYSDRYTDNADGIEGVKTSADAYVKRHHAILEEVIVGPFILGQQMTMADIYLWMLAGWMDQEWLTVHCPKIAALAAAIRQNPLVAPIHTVHFG
ncbi:MULTISPECIES: glutathione S-transferase family protein [Alphaproteobacteria]|uniref:Glutathione S-transferase n=2 Tax=Alphaproteobacteria TaxID=28211 RepID=A0A512HDZ6_9HYPH|nr:MULTISPECIES: glutathione S-transferase N-terminal domain-containing protein [Alphaproteobacteria]GEO83678.1 glutathione S-transferase [Ciceribacter naphthalenivorans]GLR24170.1 glutathione S-transferase [Ciceribacter naphthalenivorans]GLT07026.1 glutathione S-transferase [Sphingomonas psychrolutea]